MKKQTMITSDSVKKAYEILTKFWNESIPNTEYIDEALELAKTWGELWCPMYDILYCAVRLNKNLDTVYEMLNLLGIDVEGVNNDRQNN